MRNNSSLPAYVDTLAREIAVACRQCFASIQASFTSIQATISGLGTAADLDVGFSQGNVPEVRSDTGKLHPLVVPTPELDSIRRLLLINDLNDAIYADGADAVLNSWPETFSTEDNINSGNSSGYRYDGTSDFVTNDVAQTAPDLTDLTFSGHDDITISSGTAVTTDAPADGTVGNKWSTVALSGDVHLEWEQGSGTYASPSIFPAANVALADQDDDPVSAFSDAVGSYWPLMSDNAGDLRMTLYRDGTPTVYDFPAITWTDNGITFSIDRLFDGTINYYADSTLLLSEDTTFTGDLLIAFHSHDDTVDAIQNVAITQKPGPADMVVELNARSVTSAPITAYALILAEGDLTPTIVFRAAGTATGTAGSPDDAFDGDTDKTNAEAARDAAAKTVVVGKDWGAGRDRTVTRVVVTGPSDGYGSSADGNVTVNVYTSTGAASGGTLVATATAADGAGVDFTIDVAEPVSAQGIYVEITHDGTNNDCGVAHVDFYTYPNGGGPIDYSASDASITVSRDGGSTDMSLVLTKIGVDQAGSDIASGDQAFSGDSGTSIVTTIQATGRVVKVYGVIPYVE
jgi:hypothetical protein